MQEASNVSTEKNRKIGLMITLAICALGTVITLVMFSREGFHQRTDELFKWLGERLAEFFNNGYGGYIILAGALLVPLGTLFLLPSIDALARRAPAGSFLLDRVGLYFGNCRGTFGNDNTYSVGACRKRLFYCACNGDNGCCGESFRDNFCGSGDVDYCTVFYYTAVVCGAPHIKEMF